ELQQTPGNIAATDDKNTNSDQVTEDVSKSVENENQVTAQQQPQKLNIKKENSQSCCKIVKTAGPSRRKGRSGNTMKDATLATDWSGKLKLLIKSMLNYNAILKTFKIPKLSTYQHQCSTCILLLELR
uniref:Uncharacterized protein n=1 Tax=Romanomermis culicivorax TaxID=13658 RepID=A0A915HJD1_ROMCU